MQPSDRLLSWLRRSGDPYWIKYADFLEYKNFFYEIFDGFCGAGGKVGSGTAVINFLKLQDHVSDDNQYRAKGLPTDGDILNWFHETDRTLKKLDCEYSEAIGAAFSRDADYLKSVTER